MKRLAAFVVLIVLSQPLAGHAQKKTPDATEQDSPALKPSTEPVQLNGKTSTGVVATPCIQPMPVVSLRDYDGPLKKVVGVFARDLERESVHVPRYKPGVLLCSLVLKDKFILFVTDTFGPLTFLAAGFNAGIDQARDADAVFGQGMAGYGKRFGVNFTDRASSRFFKDFAYASIFREDPRYYRLSEGSPGRRLLHAAEHVVVAHRDNGNRMFNFSEWLGTASAVALSNLYHPGNQRGFAPAARQMGYSMAEDIGFDVLREFWPEVARKFKLPFRTDPKPQTSGPGTEIE